MNPKLLTLLTTFFFLSDAFAAPNLRCRAIVPSVEGPIIGGTRGHAFGSYLGNISDIGYVEEEYFISGDSQRYAVVGNLTFDGHWNLQPNGTSPFKTRILVRRPVNPKDFNGDAILEWINVSSGYDAMISDADGVYEAGYAFVGVSAQPDSIEGFTAPGTTNFGLAAWDPVRYGSLTIADENASYDIFTQAINVLKSGKIPNLKAKYVIASGESQSGIRLAAYANGVQPLANAADAIMSVVSAGQASDFQPGSARPGPSAPSRSAPSLIRGDLKIPVHQIGTETEALTHFINNVRQPDTSNYRYWEVAGGSHANALVLGKIAAYATRDGVPAPTVPSNIDQVSWLPPLDAAYQHASAWIRGIAEPPSFPLFQIGPTSSTPNVNGTGLIRDRYGNVVGGARQPEELTPIATYDGELNSLVGLTTPFNATLLNVLYSSHANYVAKLTASANKAVSEGLILPVQAAKLIAAAANANIPPATTD